MPTVLQSRDDKMTPEDHAAIALEKAKDVSTADTEEETSSKLKSLKLAAKNLLSKALRGGDKILEYIGKALLIIANLCLHLIKIVFNFFKKVVLEFGHFIPNCKKIGVPAAMAGLLSGLLLAAPAAIVQHGKKHNKTIRQILEADGLEKAGAAFVDRNSYLFLKHVNAIQTLLKEWKDLGSSQEERAVASEDERLEEDGNLDHVPSHSFSRMREEVSRRFKGFGDDVASAPRPRS